MEYPHEQAIDPDRHIEQAKKDNPGIAEQEKAEKKFSEEQLFRLEKIKEHIVGSLSIDREDFEYTPFKEKSGIGKAYQLFGESLWPLLDELNEVLAA